MNTVALPIQKPSHRARTWILFLTGVMTSMTPVRATPKQIASRSEPAFVATGIASYYADRHNGKPTASGEIFDMHALTAAHRTLPFGTKLKVTCPATGRSVIVRVNDRGPFVKGRIIDLSLAAAEHLQMVELGVSDVRLEIVP